MTAGATLERTASPSPRSGGPTGARLASLDAFRGATMAAMILVNNPGSWSHVYPPLLHAPWHGWTPTDLIFPFFLFIVGVAIPFSFAARIRRGEDRRTLVVHTLRRGAVIILLGLFLSGFPTFDLATIRIPGVLQRIGLVYLVVAPAYLFLGRRSRAALTAAVLFGYWALLSWAPWPGHVPGDLTADGNLGAFIDRAVLGGHLWSQSRTWDPEGLLSTLPAVATALAGMFAGEWIRSERVSRERRAALLLGMGVLGVVLGLVWGRVFPINKNLWTSSYVVFTAGAAAIGLALLYAIMDVWGRRGVWTRPLETFGRNALTVFVGSGLLVKVLVRVRMPAASGETTSLYTWIYERAFVPWTTPIRASLAFALVNVFFWWAVLRWMDRRGLYLKV